MKIVWLIVAGVCGVVALYFGFKGNIENAFVAVVLAAVAGFLNYRAYLKSRIDDDVDDEENS